MDYYLNKQGLERILEKIQSSFIYDEGGTITDDSTWFFRETASEDRDIGDADGQVKTIYGNTLVWNQLSNTVDDNYGGSAGLSIKSNHDGTFTVSGVATVDAYMNVLPQATIPSYNNDHVFLITGCPPGGSLSTYNLRYNVNGYGETGSGVIIPKGTNKPWDRFMIVVKAGTDLTTPIVFKPQAYDLTLMFGAGNEPQTVAEFTAMFPDAPYAYDPGTVKHVQINGIKTTGFNAFDGEFEWGKISNTGELVSTQREFRTANYIRVIPGQKYQVSVHDTIDWTAVYVAEYDSHQRFIQRKHWLAPNSLTINGYGTLTDQTCYVKFFFYNNEINYSSLPNPRVCFHLVHSGIRDSEYENYRTNYRQLNITDYFTDGLKKIGDVCDEFRNTHFIKRIGSVDLGTLTWRKITGDVDGVTHAGFLASLTSNRPAGTSEIANILCTKYRADKFMTCRWFDYENIISFRGEANVISVYTNQAIYLYDKEFDTNDYTVEQVKTALSGVILYYELAEPVETIFEHPLDWSYWCEDFGTEEWDFVNNTLPLPSVRSVITYSSKFSDTLRRLSQTYVKQSRMSSYIEEIKNTIKKELQPVLDEKMEYIQINDTLPGWPTVEDIWLMLLERNIQCAVIECNGYCAGRMVVSMEYMGIYHLSLFNLKTGGFTDQYVDGSVELNSILDDAQGTGFRTTNTSIGDDVVTLNAPSGEHTLSVTWDNLLELYYLPQTSHDDPGTIDVYIDDVLQFSIYCGNTMKGDLKGGLILKKVGPQSFIYLNADGCWAYHNYYAEQLTLRYTSGNSSINLYATSYGAQ